MAEVMPVTEQKKSRPVSQFAILRMEFHHFIFDNATFPQDGVNVKPLFSGHMPDHPAVDREQRPKNAPGLD